jgi:hypothetical protein
MGWCSEVLSLLAVCGIPSVSIPLWFDSKHFIQSTILRRLSVSIPLWFDSKELSKAIQNPRLKVSIPLWFDSKVLLTGST